MNDLSKRQRELAETRLAEAQGRSPRICPACSEIGARHWEPERMDGFRFVPGRYTCQTTPAATTAALAEGDRS